MLNMPPVVIPDEISLPEYVAPDGTVINACVVFDPARGWATEIVHYDENTQQINAYQLTDETLVNETARLSPLAAGMALLVQQRLFIADLGNGGGGQLIPAGGGER